MRLSLKTKFTLATSLLVLAVVAVVSGLYLARLTRQTLRQANDPASFVAQQVYGACGNALKEAAERGEAPASLDPADLRELRPQSIRQQQHAEFADRIGCGNFADDLRNQHQRRERQCAGFERRLEARRESRPRARR